MRLPTLTLLAALAPSIAFAAPAASPKAPATLATPASSTAPPATSTVPVPAAASEPGAATGAAPSASPVESPLRIALALEDDLVERGDVLIAVAQELATTVAPVASAEAATVRVQISRARGIVVVFRNRAGAEWLRAIALPDDPRDIPEVVALLVGNLARDEASAVLLPTQGSTTDKRLKPAPATAPPSEPAPEAAAASDVAQAAQRPSAPPETQPPLRWTPANFSVFHPVAVFPDSDQRLVSFEVGLLFSHLGGLDGVGLSLGAIYTRRDSRGLAASLGNITRGDSVGLHAAGLANVSLGHFNGLDVAGVGTFTTGETRGAAVGGMAAIGQGDTVGAAIGGAAVYTGGDLIGSQVAGVAGVTQGRVAGAQIAGAGAVALSDVVGTQIGGLGAVATGEVAGIQVAGASTYARHVSGAQLSAGVNYTDKLDGAQIGLVNIGGHVRGTQIGLVNIASKLDGAAIGLVNYVKAQTQMAAWYNGTLPVNLGLRVLSGYVCTMPSLGYDPRQEDANLSAGFSAGGRIPLGATQAFVDVEASATTPVQWNASGQEATLDLRYRALGGYQFTPEFGVFGGVSFRHRVISPDGQGANIPELTAGIQLL